MKDFIKSSIVPLNESKKHIDKKINIGTVCVGRDSV